MTILNALICSISLLCRGSPKYRFWSDNFKKLRGPQCFYSVAFGLGGKISQFLFQYFGKLPGFNLWKLTRLSEVFPPFVSHFLSGRGNVRENCFTSFTKFDWSVIFCFSFQIWYFGKWIITSIGQSKHMRVTRFNPLWVSGVCLCEPVRTLGTLGFFHQKPRIKSLLHHRQPSLRARSPIWAS